LTLVDHHLIGREKSEANGVAPPTTASPFASMLQEAQQPIEKKKKRLEGTQTMRLRPGSFAFFIPCMCPDVGSSWYITKISWFNAGAWPLSWPHY